MSNTALTGRRILVVEDDFILGLDLATMLEQAGAKVVGPVMTVQEALDALDPLPDIGTLDVQLGDETSFPVADALAQRGIPFVFATGAATMIPAEHQSGPLCQKPVSNSAVMKALSEALAA
ncbi:response regulator [Sphingomonas prati]|uniref:CheY-like chemotaxis protein n=1 Tax=Sphingomonas prati TaxID=1843237 RepID=A0A7W9BVS0_9SPHN|nr:response regulator [Sphingomonas prati]MBB5730946.1 CheY-like chemotaxis protein [Sphingomonas prati]GGE97808.1 response regulator [Sphingomonas prati]